jgi:hypothetical protein
MATKIDFGKQIGPLPLGAWIVVVGGGLGIAVWNRKNGSNDAPIPVEDTSGDAGVGVGGTGDFLPVNPPADSSGDATYETNEAWGQAAINWLIAQGYSPGIASSAITKALNGGSDISGNKMSIQEWSLWSLALTHFGSPPYPVTVNPPVSVPGPINAPGPVTKPPPVIGNKPPAPKPASTKTPPYWEEIAHRGDSISSIAARHHKGWKETWDFNLKYRSAATRAILKSRGPNLIFDGTRIWVPK